MRNLGDGATIPALRASKRRRLYGRDDKIKKAEPESEAKKGRGARAQEPTLRKEREGWGTLKFK